ncbi:hypothetical protein TOPH_04724, partial [Tolypocladium ophioglossoides CBS 100239]
MAPLIPRVHFFEIDDQPWFPTFLRVLVQNCLTQAWRTTTPPLKVPPAHMVANILIDNLGAALSSYMFIDFCAGGGGPTLYIERVVNAHLRDRGEPPVDFVLTDLHPKIAARDHVARRNPRITYESESVDASRAPEKLVRRGKKVMRLFNLSFHHFDDPLARKVLKDTVETSHGFAIFELPDRSLPSCLTVLMLGIGSVFSAPLLAWRWKSPAMLFFSLLLAFVMVFDGIVSSLRVRTPEEIDALLRSCGADTTGWEVQSGNQMHLRPWGCLNWVICRPREN